MPVAEQNKSMIKMVNVMTTQDLSYNAEGKDKFKRTSTAALRQLAKDIDLKESKVSFNAGGIAVSGDATLYGMWEENKGICVYIFQSMGSNNIMFRTIKHMKDYSGGVNQWATVEGSSADYEVFLERLLSLKDLS